MQTSFLQQGNGAYLPKGFPVADHLQEDAYTIGQDTCSYRLVIYPDATLCDRLLAEREAFSSIYGTDCGLAEKPGITVARFSAKEMMEETLVRWMGRICSLQQGFTVTLNNYSGIPDHSIYWRIQDPHPFYRLSAHLKKIDDLLCTNAFPPVKLVVKPGLSLAVQLPAAVYEQAMPVYSRRTFHASFGVSGLVLLKREHALDRYRITQVFPLMPFQSHAA